MTEKEKEGLENTDAPKQEEAQTEPDSNDSDVEIIADDDNDDEEIVTDPEEEIAQLKQSVQETQEKYLRSLADMDNLRKRARRDVEEARINGRANILEELLPALDSIDMALKSIAPTEENQAVYDGMIMVQKQFLSSMERFELKAVEAVGQKFDPMLHEAVSYIPSPDHDSGEIMDEMRKGYALGDRLIRASMVVVSSGKPEIKEEEPVEEAEESNQDESTDAESTQSSSSEGN